MIKKGKIIEGQISSNINGSAYVISDESNIDIYIHKKHINQAFHMDTVKVEILKVKNDFIEGKIIEVIERFKNKFVGTLEVLEKYAFLIPDSNKIHKDIYIPLKDIKGGLDGQKVVVEITDWGNKEKKLRGKVIKVIGNSGEHNTEMHAILEEYGLPYEFPEDIIEESNEISNIITQSEIDKRLDMRNVLTFTIDSETAKDLDDALSVRWVNGLLEIGVHIADVSYYVKNDSLIYEEAYKRGTSVYLVDRCIPMLPTKLSNDLCSLNPNTDKLVYSFIFYFNKSGKLIDKKFNKGIINSNYRLTYTEVQKVIEGGETYTNQLKESILILDKYAKKLRKKRFKNNPLNFKSSEIKFILDEENKPIDLLFKEQNDANFLIEEFMVLTNMKVCEFISNKGFVSIHRIHEKPDPTKLENLKSYVTSLGYSLDLNDEDKIKENLNKLLIESFGTPEENSISNLVVRCMSKAKYSTENIGHYGLGLTHYVHVTSPIRRFCDLKIHEQLNLILPNNGYLF